MELTRLKSLQEETKADSTSAELTDLIITGWPDSMQDLPEHLHPYWCFRNELKILDGLVMKGNRVEYEKYEYNYENWNLQSPAHQGLTPMLQRARCTVYWPKLQDDITEMIQRCDVMIARGTVTRSPDLQSDRSQQHVQWKSWAWIWLSSGASMPWSQSAWSPMTPLIKRQPKLPQKC